MIFGIPNLKPNAKYRVLEEFSSRDSIFEKDTIIKFIRSAHIRYDSLTEYFFEKEDGEYLFYHDLDGQSSDHWKKNLKKT